MSAQSWRRRSQLRCLGLLVRGKMITEVRDIIVNSAEQQGQPAKTAREYMSAPAIGAGIGKRQSARADELMLHFGLKAISVFKTRHSVCCGLLDARQRPGQTAHGLGREIRGPNT